jgi:trk system potassium uptake protein
MKIVIAGAGEVGKYLARMLIKEYHDIVVIDTDERRLQYIESSLDLMTIKGSCSSINTLLEAGVSNSDLYIAVTISEEINILSAVFAKRLGAKKTVSRVDKLEYIEPKNKPYLLGLGLDRLIYPEYIAAKEVVGLLKQTGTSEIFEFSGGKLTLFVIRLTESASIKGMTLSEAADFTKNNNYRAVAITREDKTIIPKGDDQLLEGDLVYVITNPAGIKSLIKYSGKEHFDINNVMILGGSRIGRKVAKQIESYLNVKLIEIDTQKSELIANDLVKTLVINADGRDMDMLRDEGIEKMDAFVAVTGNAETNILSCVMAKKFGVKRTIAEIENMEYIDLANQMGIDTIINKKLSAASRIYTFTMKAEVASIKCLTGSEAEVLEFVVQKDADITKDTLRNVHFPKSAIIGGVVRGNKSFIATGDTRIKPQDKVVVFALPEAIFKIEDYFN